MVTDTVDNQQQYYVPEPSARPFFMVISLIVMLAGFAIWLNGGEAFGIVSMVGVAMVLSVFFSWFRAVIRENRAGAYKRQEDMTFRIGMGWFIFSEVMFFASFFGALFFIRMLAVPWLGGDGTHFATNALLWQGFEAAWPTNGPANVGGAFESMSPWGIALLNTCLLLSSGVTITIAHWGLKQGNRLQLVLGLVATVILGSIFLGCQAYEYMHAYQHMNLTLNSGVYGSTFFMLTGFHGAHVTLGTIMLIVILLRSLRGHFSPQDHFGFEGVAWYWHFVDVVWLGLFVFVYVL